MQIVQEDKYTILSCFFLCFFTDTTRIFQKLMILNGKNDEHLTSFRLIYI